jgi:hypothetical protein
LGGFGFGGVGSGGFGFGGLGLAAGGFGFGFAAGGFGFGAGGFGFDVGGVGVSTGGANGASRRVVAESSAVHGADGSGAQDAVAVLVVVPPREALTATATCTSTDWLATSVPRLQRSSDPFPVSEHTPGVGWRVIRTKRAPVGARSVSVVCGAGSGPELLTRMS